MKRARIIIILILTILTVEAQEISSLKMDTKKAIIDTIINCFKNNYVNPDSIVDIEDSLLPIINNELYSEVNETEIFIDHLSSHLRKIFRDRHIGLKYIENLQIEVSNDEHSVLSEQLNEKMEKNFYFKKVERLPGNIGYIRFDRFDDPVNASETADAAMSFVSHCDAIIIDLRYNYGGEENMVKYLANYFFSNPTHINNLYFTKQDSIVQTWTNGNIPFNRLVDKDLYILTSSNTASAAEAFTYTLKNYDKAITIGETTAGAAHWAGYFQYPSLNLEIKMPIARPINPITNTDWERIGIKPDIEIQEYHALDKAYLTALNRLQSELIDEAMIQDLDWYKFVALEKLNNGSVSEIKLADYTGEYEDIKLLIKDNYLFWHQSDNSEFILIPISTDHFVFDDSDDYVVRFVRDTNLIVEGYQLLVKNRKNNPIHPKTK